MQRRRSCGARHGVPYRTVHVLLLMFMGWAATATVLGLSMFWTRFCVFLIKGNQCLFDAVLRFKEQICDAVQVIKAFLCWSSVLWSSFYLFLQLQLLCKLSKARVVLIISQLLISPYFRLESTFLNRFVGCLGFT